jgi:hypothetical protein
MPEWSHVSAGYFMRGFQNILTGAPNFPGSDKLSKSDSRLPLDEERVRFTVIRHFDKPRPA